METRQTTTQKIVLSTLTLNGNWIKSLLNLHSNQHQEKSTTRCNGLPTTNNIPLHILHFFPPQTYQNSHTQSPQLSQSPQITYPQPSPAPQRIYPLAAPQITYPTPTTTKSKIEPNPPPLPQQAHEPSQQLETFPTHDTILTITGGSNTDFETKRQRGDYYHQVNHVIVEGPITQTRWFHMPITFSS
jgi:hypothetical protein